MTKKILFVISNTEIGGPQKSLLALLDKINYDIFSVDILVIDPGGKLVHHFNENARILKVDELITAIVLPKKKIIKSLLIMLKHKKIKMATHSIFLMLRHLFLKNVMNQERQILWKKFNNDLPQIKGEYDLAFGILGMSTYLIADLVKARRKFHWIRSDTRILKLNEEIEKKYHKEMDGFLAVSNETAKIFTEIYPFSKENMNVFYNYIPIQFYNSMRDNSELMNVSSKEIKLLTISRLDPLKGLDLAISACKILIEEGYKIKWYILGDGRYRKEVEKLIIDNDLSRYFILLGFQMNTLSFIKKADIVVHPSRSEGKSNAVDEAQFIGKPLVVTRYETVNEQVNDGFDGLIAEIDSVDLAQKIKILIEDKMLQKKLANNCIKQRTMEIDPNDFLLKLMWNEGKKSD